VKEFRPGVMTVGERNPNYWRDGHPYVDGYELFGIVDHVARVNALLAGDVHMVSSVRGAGIQQVEKADNAQIFKTEAPYYLAFQSAIDMAPMNNHDLRLGISYLLDRKRFIDVVLKGYGSIGNDHPFMTNSVYYNSSLPQRELDLDKAKFHLTKSGIGKSPIDLHVSDVAPYSVDLAQLVQREAARAGFNLNIRREPADSYWNTIPGNRAFFANVLNPRPTYGMLLNLTWKSGVPWNYSHFSDKTLDSLINQAQESLDADLRKRLYGDIQKIIHDLAAKIIPAHIYFIDGVSNKVKGLTPVPVGNLGGFNWGDSVWIDS
jgi:peptide/nickel transport system substrate-binding protein